MDLSEVFKFDKSVTALKQLERVITCWECNNMYENPRRHNRCGKTLCMCEVQDKKTCPACGEEYNQDLPVDWLLNNVIDGAKTIRKLITAGTCNTTDTQMTNTNDNVGSSQELENCEAEKANANVNVPSSVFKIPECPKSKVTRSTTKRKSESDDTPRRSCRPQTSPKRLSGKMKRNAMMKRNAKGETLLHTACVKGDRRKVEELLGSGANPCTKDNAGWTPLHEAASKGYTEIVKLLLEWGAMVNVPGGYNNTPLHDAVLHNHKECAQLLMSYGAKPDIQNIDGNTARHMVQTDEMKLILDTDPGTKVAQRKGPAVEALEDPVLFGCDLSGKSQIQLMSVARQFALKHFTKYSSEVTVIIVAVKNNNQCRVSIPVLHGILKGNWIVGLEWLKSCADSNELVDPSQYEVDGTSDHPHSRAPKKGRENAQNMLPSLFNGCHFYFSGGSKYTVAKDTFTKADLKALVVSGGGKVLNREPDPESIPSQERVVPYHTDRSGPLARCAHFIVYQPGRTEPQLKYNMVHVKSLPVTWFLECVETFTLLEP